MKKLQASSLVEFVIALSIIGICFSVASYIFIQGNRSTIQFQEVREQTEFQSLLFNALIHDTFPATENWEGVFTQIDVIKGSRNEEMKNIYYLKSSGKQLWEQEFYMDEKR
jgi:type II secretory pathway pseudopilin PulG